jgi:hypothetical protein
MANVITHFPTQDNPTSHAPIQDEKEEEWHRDIDDDDMHAMILKTMA